MATFRIAVLSDQHIDIRAAPESWERARLAFRTALAQGPDHVILAGDTFDCATAMIRDGARVRAYLKRLGLWHRDRLTIVPGNHDIFHTPHHGTAVYRLREVSKIRRRDAMKSYNAFCDLAADLTADEDLLDDAGDRFPHHKRLDHVHLLVADTTAAKTAFAGNGFWPKDADETLRAAIVPARARRVLAIHHPPFEDRLQRLRDLLRGEFPFGFPRPDLRRLKGLVRDARIEAILCGHVHDTGGVSYRWRVDEAEAFMVGRTGGVHVPAPILGLLDVPRTGRLKWTEVAF